MFCFCKLARKGHSTSSVMIYLQMYVGNVYNLSRKAWIISSSTNDIFDSPETSDAGSRQYSRPQSRIWGTCFYLVWWLGLKGIFLLISEMRTFPPWSFFTIHLKRRVPYLKHKREKTQTIYLRVCLYHCASPGTDGSGFFQIELQTLSLHIDMYRHRR